jgi:hypothetical protein
VHANDDDRRSFDADGATSLGSTGMARRRDAIDRGLGVALATAIAWSCGGAQQGYYGPCDEPAGLVVDCEEPPPIDAFTVWDACEKLASCGIVLVEDEGMDDPRPTFDDCIAEVEAGQDMQGDPLLACIEETSCPDLARLEDTAMMDPNPAEGRIEGILGFCGRLDPNGQ